MTNFTGTIPLRRLLKRREVEALLAEFKVLRPELNLALVEADGQPFICLGQWPPLGWANPAKLAEWLTQAQTGEIVQAANARLYPLRLPSQFVGVLVAHALQPHSSQTGPSDTTLRCLHLSLNLLLDQALALRHIAAETLERYREINLLYHTGETIGACLEADQIPALILAEAGRVIQSEVSLVLLPPASGSEVWELKASLGQNHLVAALYQMAQSLVGQVSRTGRPDIFTGDSQPFSAVLCAPLKAQEQVLGVVMLSRGAGQPIFTAGDEKLVMALTNQAASAMERARLYRQEIKRQRLEEELAIGRRIQLGLLPQAVPVLPGWEFAAIYQAARQVGGDLYDFFELPGEPRRLGLVIADVSGKGVPAALFMAFSRTVIRTEAMSARPPAAMLEQANRLIVQDNRSRLFLSAFYATLDTHTGRLVYANGGHNWPLWLRYSRGEVLELTARSMVLGMFREIQLQEIEIDIAPGDLLLFYTDGVTEARNAAGELFGEERLQAILTANSSATAEQVQQKILANLKSFIGDTPPSDDFTLLVVKRGPITL
jgi:serine phosphatase RsbU (regulator of sigma subunit)